MIFITQKPSNSTSPQLKVKDMPKLHSPFKRERINGEYVVTPQIREGFEWVFENDAVIASEKLDGENVSIIVKKGRIIDVWNRENHIEPFSRNPDHHHALKGLLNSLAKGYIDDLEDGQHFGELVGLNVQGNPYELKEPLWIPLKRIHDKHSYNSWGKYPKTFETISNWFKTNLISLFYAMNHRLKFSDPQVKLAEGIVFVHPDGRMAKLRRDMFEWYKGPRHKQ
mgnify:CR=1 FL=1